MRGGLNQIRYHPDRLPTAKWNEDAEAGAHRVSKRGIDRVVQWTRIPRGWQNDHPCDHRGQFRPDGFVGASHFMPETA